MSRAWFPIALAVVATALPNASAGTVEDAPEALRSSVEDMLQAELDGVPPITESSPKCSLRLRWHVGIPQVKSPVVPNHYLVIARDEAEVIGTCVSDAPIDAAPVVKITFEYFDSSPGVEEWKVSADPPPCEFSEQSGKPAQAFSCPREASYPPAENHESVGYWHRAKFQLLSPVLLGPYYSGISASTADLGDAD